MKQKKTKMSTGEKKPFAATLILMLAVSRQKFGRHRLKRVLIRVLLANLTTVLLTLRCPCKGGKRNRVYNTSAHSANLAATEKSTASLRSGLIMKEYSKRERARKTEPKNENEAVVVVCVHRNAPSKPKRRFAASMPVQSRCTVQMQKNERDAPVDTKFFSKVASRSFAAAVSLSPLTEFLAAIGR